MIHPLPAGIGGSGCFLAGPRDEHVDGELYELRPERPERRREGQEERQARRLRPAGADDLPKPPDGAAGGVLSLRLCHLAKRTAGAQVKRPNTLHVPCALP